MGADPDNTATSMIAWEPAPEHPILTPGEVHVWCAELALPAATMARMAQLLSDEERERAARFRVVPPRQQFIAAHGTLRILLGRYLDIPPQDAQFRYGSHGKPALKHPGSPPLEFNLAHGGHMAVYAFAAGMAVGIDLEPVTRDVDVESIMTHFFSVDDATALHALPETHRRTGFFKLWTTKEAILKGAGSGLTPHLEIPEGWHVQTFVPAPDYAAALATPQPPVRVRFFSYSEKKD